MDPLLCLYFAGNSFWSDLKKESGSWYHDGGILPTYTWTTNAQISGDGICIEFLYSDSGIVYNDLDCDGHNRKYMCEYDPA